MCNKCINFHFELFQNHNVYNLDKCTENIFTGFCKEKNHKDELDYFCKTHNKLCCCACIAKIYHKGKGQHKDCNICIIEEIKDEKKNNLNENIKLLNDMSSKIEQSINQLKTIFDKINNNKEQLKLKIQRIFTKIRNLINEREDELLSEIDNQFQNLFISEDIIKESEKLPNKIQIALEKSKINENEWNDEKKLSSLINNCIFIEDNIKTIKLINENIEKNKNSIDSNITFLPENEEININLIKEIKEFGKIIVNNSHFKFKKCPLNISEHKKYIVSGEKQNIITKTGIDGFYYGGIICENYLKNNQIHKWKLKILKTNEYNIMVGVAPIDFDINSSKYDNCGWYFYCESSTLYSGPPHNYKGKKTNLNKVKNEIVIIMDMNKRTLKFIIDNEDKGESYTDIPIDKELTPAVHLLNSNDSVEIINQ